MLFIGWDSMFILFIFSANTYGSGLNSAFWNLHREPIFCSNSECPVIYSVVCLTLQALGSSNLHSRCCLCLILIKFSGVLSNFDRFETELLGWNTSQQGPDSFHEARCCWSQWRRLLIHEGLWIWQLILKKWLNEGKPCIKLVQNYKLSHMPWGPLRNHFINSCSYFH